MKTFDEIVKLNQELIAKFKKVEQKPWSAEANLVELTKQVGALSKYVMVYEKYYFKSERDKNHKRTELEDISDQLADIFFCLVRIGDHYKIDLEESVLRMVDQTNEMLKKID